MIVDASILLLVVAFVNINFRPWFEISWVLEKKRKGANGENAIDKAKDLSCKDKIKFLALTLEALDRGSSKDTGDEKDEYGNDDGHDGCCLIVDASILLHSRVHVNINFWPYRNWCLRKD